MICHYTLQINQTNLEMELFGVEEKVVAIAKQE